MLTMLVCVFFCPSTGKLDITSDDPRWIGAWWGGFLLCGALLFFSSLFMFGFPQTLSDREKDRDGGGESEQAMLPSSSLPLDYNEMPKSSNGVGRNNHEPINGPTCFQQLRGENCFLSLHSTCSICAVKLTIVMLLYIPYHITYSPSLSHHDLFGYYVPTHSSIQYSCQWWRIQCKTK